jgi:HEAT repeat protein
VDAELRRLTTLIDGVAGGPGGPDPTGPLPEEDEPRFVVRAADADPGVRFSALVRLGRRRSDRSVQVSLARLDDPDDSVVWIAVHNLGGFRERDAAPEIAALLDHPAALVRQKAHDTLVRLGAPADTGFEALDSPEVRELAAARLRSWADE